MHPLHLVYDFGSQSISYDFLYTLPFVILGVICFLYHKKIKNDAASFTNMNRMQGMIFGIIFFSISVIMMMFAGISSFTAYFKAKNNYEHHHYSVIEGRVENYHPYGGHDPEHFTVNGVYFECIDHDETEFDYNKSASHGKVIRPKLFVRIYYFTDGKENVIIKLETE